MQQDSFPGLLWADAIYGQAIIITADQLQRIPGIYGAAAIRRVLAREAERSPQGPTGPSAPPDAAADRGREIFANRIVGTIANRQLFKESPPLYAAAKLGGAAHLPILAPIDEGLPPVFPVRCADCHSATPGGAPVPIQKVRETLDQSAGLLPS